MKKKILVVSMACVLSACVLAGCQGKEENSSSSDTPKTAVSESPSKDEDSDTEDKVADESDMTDVVDVVEDGMVPVEGSEIEDGTYDVTVDSSSSMFKITKCELTVKDGEMTAVMTMSGTGYLYVYMGSAKEAAKAEESDYISYEENENGEHTFTVPVEALDKGIACAAFSKRKEMWYDRTLLFRADSLPEEVRPQQAVTSVDSLNLEDGEYTVEVAMKGGSGKASVESPTKLVVENGACTATVTWSSSNYDYMKIGEEKYLPVNTEGNSSFEIPVDGFDYGMKVIADTTAMSTPHEIEYTLNFDSATIEKK